MFSGTFPIAIFTLRSSKRSLSGNPDIFTVCHIVCYPRFCSDHYIISYFQMLPLHPASVVLFPISTLPDTPHCATIKQSSPMILLCAMCTNYRFSFLFWLYITHSSPVYAYLHLFPPHPLLLHSLFALSFTLCPPTLINPKPSEPITAPGWNIHSFPTFA